MGKPTGFLDYPRQISTELPPEDRIKNFDEFHVPISKKEQQIQGARCMDCGVPFCNAGVMMNGISSGCPLANLIPEWNDMIYTDSYDYALDRLLMTNSFPEFTGRVCPALCEYACTCGLYGEPVTVKENELAIIEWGFAQGKLDSRRPETKSGKAVAVVGSGPAGLAAANILSRRGHEVTVFEREDRVGGLLMYGIPSMKLDKSVIDRRIKIMEAQGVRFVTGVDVGRDKQPQELMEEFDAVVLATGATQPRDISVPGREGDGIYFAVDFLKSTTKSLLSSQLKDGSYISAKGKKVMVIGGGDTGNDCVGTSIRHGCESVVQLEMMSRKPDSRAENNPWPQWPLVEKVDYGQQEAIWRFGRDPRQYDTTVKEFILDEKGGVRAAVTVRLKWEHDPETGRMTACEIPDSQETVETDLVLIAAGFLGPEEYVAEGFGVDKSARGTLLADDADYRTSRDMVFAAGDARRGQSLVVWAIREGQEAARSVEKRLLGYSNA